MSGFATSRLRVLPWHELGEEALTAAVLDVLTPAVTASLPPDWAGVRDEVVARRWIADRDAESTGLVAIERSTGAPVGFLLHAGEDEVRVGYVLAESTWGQGYATELLGGWLAEVRSTGVATEIVAGVAPDHGASIRVLERCGFVPDGVTEGGERQFRTVVAGDVTVRPERPADHAAIRDVVVRAFGEEAEGELVERIRTSERYVPELALVAEIGGAVVGHVMVSGATLRHDRGERPIVMLSPLAVAPAGQGRGVGSALVLTVVRATDRRGEPLVVLEGDPRYYGRLGFRPAAAHGLSLPLPDWAGPEAAQVCVLAAYDPDDPTLRGRVVYPPAFDGIG